MDLILDSNIYRSDFLLRSNDFNVLLDYLHRTDSSIYFPQIVLDEVKELHKRTLKERIVALNKSLNNYNLMIVDEQKRIKLDQINESTLITESEKYIAYIKSKLEIEPPQILPPKDSYLSEISNRAIKRERPCGDDGQGFRDTIIWLTLKDYCIKSRERQITFISNNDKDFANAERTDLHEALLNECNTMGIRINYFKNLKDFIEQQSTKIDFITEDWLRKNLDFNSFNEQVLHNLNVKNSMNVIDYITRKTGHEPSGYCNATQASSHSIDNFSVYEMLDGTYIVNVTFDCEVEVEYEYYSYEYDHYDSEYTFGHRRHVSNNYRPLNIYLYASLTIKEKEIIDFEIDDLYL